jgi:hypothetical protein
MQGFKSGDKTARQQLCQRRVGMVGSTGRAVFAAALSLALPGVGHFFLAQRRGIWFAIPSVLLLYLHFAGLWEFADVAFLSLGIFCAFDAFSFAQRGYGII